MRKRFLFVLASALWWGGAAQAAMITVGDHAIAPNVVTPITILVEAEAGDPQIAAVDFAIQISDGVTGPTIGQVDLETGTAFASNNIGGSNDKGSLPRQAFWEIITDTGTVPIPSPGILATVQIDATGISSGTYEVRLTSVQGVNTQFFDGQINSVPLNQGEEIIGSVTIVPEPAALLAWGALIPLLSGRRGQKRACTLS